MVNTYFTLHEARVPGAAHLTTGTLLKSLLSRLSAIVHRGNGRLTDIVLLPGPLCVSNMHQHHVFVNIRERSDALDGVGHTLDPQGRM